ncbi:UNKNOWN [Stylonychia lemnae]|uniref:Uncharacterized protein n=1 Tax=Stylonychia lemnae TaxID=5949 RepID=A0A078ABC6_STYLE|nr:UNKNOWN [Stylonychia lemnae]|eukprot:CDW79469.1 UNKNOWN [Stylonychia lemnae]
MNAQDLSDGQLQYLNQHFNNADSETQEQILTQYPNLFELFTSLGLPIEYKSGNEEGIDLGSMKSDSVIHRPSPQRWEPTPQRHDRQQ